MSALEQKRSALEDIERYERMVVDLLDTVPKVHRERLLQSHRVRENKEDQVLLLL